MILARDRFAILSDIWGRFRSLSLISPIEPTVGQGDDGFLWIDIGVDGTPDNPLWKMWDEHAATWRLIGGGAGAVGWDDVTGKPATFPPETHTHSKLVASDGDPDPALSADDDGNLLTAGHISLPSMKQLRVLSAGSIQRGEVELYLLEGESAYGIQVDSANRVALCNGGAMRLIAGPSGVKLQSGVSITEFSSDGTLGDNSDAAVPTEKAVKTYVTTLDSAKVSKLAASDGDPADAVSVDAEGRVSLPYQPCFLAYNSATDENVTGDSAPTIATIDFDTEVYDTDGNFAADVFTAPVDGRYLFVTHFRVTGLGASHTRLYAHIYTSNRNYAIADINPYVCQATFGLGVFGAAIAHMEANDTAQVLVAVKGTDKSVDVYGGADLTTWFSGARLV